MLAASQVGPSEAISNLGRWAELIGFHPTPLFLATKGIDQWVAIGAILVLIALGVSWVMEYEILRGYVRQHGGETAFASVAPRRMRAIAASLVISVSLIIGISIFSYYSLSKP
jgi:hypothetical protein